MLLIRLETNFSEDLKFKAIYKAVRSKAKEKDQYKTPKKLK